MSSSTCLATECMVHNPSQYIERAMMMILLNVSTCQCLVIVASMSMNSYSCHLFTTLIHRLGEADSVTMEGVDF